MKSVARKKRVWKRKVEECREGIKDMDKAPVEAQKSLIQALIKNIIVYDDKIAINMYIGDVLPTTLQKKTPREKIRGVN